MSSLRVKLTLALIVTGLSGVIIVTVLIQRYTTIEFDNFVVEQERANFIADMTAYYEVYGHGRYADRAQVAPPPSSSILSDTRPSRLLSIRFMLIDQKVSCYSWQDTNRADLSEVDMHAIQCGRRNRRLRDS
jgi:hypothetical protein